MRVLVALPILCSLQGHSSVEYGSESSGIVGNVDKGVYFKANLSLIFIDMNVFMCTIFGESTSFGRRISFLWEKNIIKKLVMNRQDNGSCWTCFTVHC